MCVLVNCKKKFYFKLKFLVLVFFLITNISFAQIIYYNFTNNVFQTKEWLWFGKLNFKNDAWSGGAPRKSQILQNQIAKRDHFISFENHLSLCTLVWQKKAAGVKLRGEKLKYTTTVIWEVEWTKILHFFPVFRVLAHLPT